MKRVALAGVALLGLVVVLVLVRHGEVGLWDWDTYGRLQFIDEYDATQYLDGHLLYHGVMRALMALGFTSVGAVLVETALGMAALIGLVAWIAWREGLSRQMTAVALVATTLGSPGLVAMFLIVEDNVLYFPVVLAIFYVQYQVGGAVIRRGVLLGALLAIAMLINVSLLVLLLAIAPAAALTAVRDRRRALGLAVAIATALAGYYLAHVVPFTGAKIAMHEFLPQALGLQDFAQSTTPLLSLERFEQYRGGLRAIALTPELHQIAVPAALRWVLVSLLPVLVAGSAVVLAGSVAVARRGEIWRGALARIDLVATLAVSVVFPYFYEPFSIERWDVFWLGALFVLVLVLKRPSRLALGLVGAILVAQAVGTIVTIAHDYGAWADPAVARWRRIARDLARQGSDVVVVPYEMERTRFADFAFLLGRQAQLFLVREDGACFRILFLVEHPVELSEVQAAIRTAKHPYLDATVAKLVRP